MSRFLWKIRAALYRLDRANSAMWNRLRARGARPRKVPEKFAHYPEHRSLGSFDTGQELKEGVFYYAGERLAAPTRSIWSVASPAPEFTAETHGFNWLDDLAAVGDAESCALAQAWVLEWIRRYGTGKGPGWTAALTGRRILRICSHARFLLHNLDATARHRIFSSLARQLNYLGKSWKHEATGRQRIEALAGMVYAGVSFAERRKTLDRINSAIGHECSRSIDARGEIPTRNPEELMELFTQFVWVYRTLEDAGVTPDPRLVAALEHTAPTLRALRLGDGTLTRFHGGGRGREGRLDQVLSDSRIRGSRAGELAMGFDRMTAARITLIVDCAKPPVLSASAHGHASTLAFEMSSSRQPIIVNCGAGRAFGEEWEHVSRATGAHNTVVVGNRSSSIIDKPGFVSDTFGERLLKTPQTVTRARSTDRQGTWLLTSHDGYADSFGVIHQRRLFLGPDGKELRGQDTLEARTDAQRVIADRAGAIPFEARFHLHPDIRAQIIEDEKAIALLLPNKEMWVFRHQGGELALENSVYLDQWRLKPRATKQIVVSSRVVEYAGQITWIFKRVKDGERTPVAEREAPT